MSSAQENTASSPDSAQADKLTIRNKVGLWLGPLLFSLILLFLDLDPGNPLVTRMAAIVVLMATWWITEAIPIPATALLPIVLFPFMGIMRGRLVAPEYMDYYIFLFLGGFIIAIAVEKWNLHKRIALNILRVIGGEPHRLVLGFMVATGFLSMWLSNTATTMMMMPMALSLIVLYEELNKQTVSAGGTLDSRAANFSLVLMLSIAYSASIGGLATLIGTPPNLILVAQMGQLFPDAPEISFPQWMFFALPLSVVFMLIAWVALCRFIYPLPKTTPFSGKEFIDKEIQSLGSMSNEEKKVAAVFVTVALLWMARKDLVFDADFVVYGWSHWLDVVTARFNIGPVASLLDDGTIAISMALMLFILPASKEKGGRLLSWQEANKLPWGILLLFGGGLAVAKGFSVSGLSVYIAGQFAELLGDASPLVIVLSTVTFVTGLTELTSNTATASMALPIMASLAQAIEVSPLLLVIPTVLAASCAFMLPVSTPPNAIVYGSGRIPITKMIIAGLWLDLIAVVLLTTFVYTMGQLSFDVLGGFPEWARPGL